MKYIFFGRIWGYGGQVRNDSGKAAPSIYLVFFQRLIKAMIIGPDFCITDNHTFVILCLSFREQITLNEDRYMNFKKIMASALALTLCSSMLLTSCQGKGANKGKDIEEMLEDTYGGRFTLTDTVAYRPTIYFSNPRSYLITSITTNGTSAKARNYGSRPRMAVTRQTSITLCTVLNWKNTLRKSSKRNSRAESLHLI